MARLGEILTISASKQENNDEKKWLLNLDMVEQQTGNILAYNYVSENELNGSIIAFDAGNVLYSKLRPNLNKVVLPCCSGYATSEMLPLRPNTDVLTREYLTAYLRSDGFVNWAVSKTAGAKMPRLGTNELLNKEMPLPSLNEQYHITSILDKLNSLIFLRKQQLAKLDELVKARFVEMFGNPIINDGGFPTKKGADFFKLANGKAVPDEKRFRYGVPAYGGNGISWYTDKALFYKDTIVIGRVGFQSGNVHFARGPLWITDNAMYMTEYNASEYNLVFLYALMEHINFTRFQDAGDLKKITQKPFMQTDYILPPMSLQKKYISFFERIGGQKLTIQQSLDKLMILKKSLMQEYFG